MPRKYTDEQRKYLISIVPGHSYKEIADMFNKKFQGQESITIAKVKSFVGNNRLNTGRTGRFEKGNIPFNSGLKGYCPGGRCAETQFKKGRFPHNYHPVGTERARTARYRHGHYGDDYIDVKIADPNKWKAKHILIWEKHNGPVPKGHVVIFGDRNNRNFDTNNLVLVSRKQLAVLNKKGLIQNDADLTRSAVVVADLYSKISEAKKKVKNKAEKKAS